MKTIIKNIVLISFTLFVILSCNNQINKDIGSFTTGSVAFDFSSSFRTIRPADDKSYDITSFSITGIGPNGESLTGGTKTNTS